MTSKRRFPALPPVLGLSGCPALSQAGRTFVIGVLPVHSLRVLRRRCDPLREYLGENRRWLRVFEHTADILVYHLGSVLPNHPALYSNEGGAR